MSVCGKIDCVNQARVTKEERRGPLGTVACITTGFEIVARHPELIVLPLLLDLFLWLGPRLSIAPLLRNILAFLRQMMLADSTLTGSVEAYAIIEETFRLLSEGFNLFSALSSTPLLSVPTLMPVRMSAVRPLGEQPTIEVTSFLTVLGIVIGLSFIGLALNALFMRGVGRSVVQETESPLPGPQGLGVTWLQFLKLGVMLVALLLIFSMAASFVVTITGFFSMLMAVIVMTLASSSILFVGAHLIFSVPGMLLMHRRPLRALRESLVLARADFLNVLLLLGLIWVISQGLNVVWSLPSLDTWAAVIGLAGHAFVSTSLTTALFVFYQERLCHLEAAKVVFAVGEAKDAARQSPVGE